MIDNRTMDGLSYGGGGGYTQSRLEVVAGQVLTIQVGNGGRASRSTGKPMKLFGGGLGGVGVMGPSGGNGGGFTAVVRDAKVVAAAGGGGGGGATDYCCAHGGAGGNTMYLKNGAFPRPMCLRNGQWSHKTLACFRHP